MYCLTLAELGYIVLLALAAVAAGCLVLFLVLVHWFVRQDLQSIQSKQTPTPSATGSAGNKDQLLDTFASLVDGCMETVELYPFAIQEVYNREHWRPDWLRRAKQALKDYERLRR